jgi:hypothetical protein
VGGRRRLGRCIGHVGLDEHDLLAGGGLAHEDAHGWSRHVLRRRLGLGRFGQLALDLQIAHVLHHLGQQATGARVVDGRLVVVAAEHEVAVQELLALAHLALVDGAQVRRVADDVGRQEEQQVGLLRLSCWCGGRARR